MAETGLAEHSPLTHARITVRGLVIEERHGAIASIAARNGAEEALRSAVARHWFVALPSPGRRIEAEGVAFVWAGPGKWLAITDEADDYLDWRLREVLGEHASVTLQGDGRCRLRLSGPSARDALSRLVPIDLHERAFAPGDTALTLAGHVNVQISCLSAAPVYELLCWRGSARDVVEALEAAVVAV